MKKFKPTNKFIAKAFVFVAALTVLLPAIATLNPTPVYAACNGAQSPDTANCALIPWGCPGSTTGNVPVNKNVDVTCPYPPAGGSWTCPYKSCAFGSTTVQQGQAYPASGTTPNTQASADASTGCDFGGNPLTWIACPVVGVLEQFIRWVDNFIMDSLEFNTTAVFITNGGFYAAFNSFRILATAVLVIVGIVMVTSQALGFEFLDAYTIKKTLPRILIAVIGLTLAWPLMRFVIDFFNVFGRDVREIIYGPFSPQVKEVLNSKTLFVLDGAILATLAALGMGASLSFLVTAMLAVLVGFIIILVRYLAIIVLIIFAPVAIVCYILPNTQKIWNLWRENFMGLLLVFPIISAFIAVGHVFSAVSLLPNNGAEATVPHVTPTFGATSHGMVVNFLTTPAQALIGGASSTAIQIIGFVAYFLPYFLLPIAFRLATGIIGSIAGFVNDRNRGAFDRLKKYRGNQTAKNMAAMRSGERFNNRVGNTITSRATTRNFGLGRRGREAYDNKMQLSAGAFAKSEQGMAVQHKDPVLQAMTYGSAIEAENRLAQDFGMNQDQIKSAIAGVRAAGGFGKARQTFAAKQLAATGTGYEDESQMFATIARVSGGNKELADSMWGEMRGTSERAGRNDLKASYGMGSQILGDIINQGNAKAAAKSYTTADGREVEGIDKLYSKQFTDFGVDAARGVDGMSRARNKPKSLTNMMKRLDQSRAYHENRASDARLSAEERRYSQNVLGQVRAVMDNMAANTAYGPEVNAEAVNGMRLIPKDENGRTVEAFNGARNAGIQTVYTPAREAQERTVHQQSYQEERLQRPQIDPRLGPGRDGDEPHA